MESEGKSLKIARLLFSFQTMMLKEGKLEQRHKKVGKAPLYFHDKLLTVRVSLYHLKLFILYEEFSF